MITRRAIGRSALAAAVAAAGTSLIAPALRAQGAPLRAPDQTPILTVSGRIRNTNRAGAALFDRPMLQALGMATISTTTPWYDGRIRFDGPPMAALMRAVGAEGEKVTAIALNDYSTDIPVSDFDQHGVILAMLRGGEPMPVGDKGPLFVVYPYDAKPELRSRVYYSRSAWSVAQLIVS